ncbi:MAG: hypothetical protein AB1832_01055 [Pseudomonadota bacterium]
MKARFRIASPNLLLEATPGDLFVPLGPDLTECVCAVVHADPAEPAGLALDPCAHRTVVVIACRVGRGEPEYFAPGFSMPLSGAAPIQFVRSANDSQFEARGDASALQLSAEELVVGQIARRHLERMPGMPGHDL